MSSKRKQAHRGSPTKIVVNVRDPDADVDPIVASFPGGLPEHLKGDEAPKFAWRKLSEKSKRGRILVGEDSTCRYRARSEGRGYDGRRTKLCVGLYNKRTGKLTLHQAAEKGTVFCLEQSVRSYQDSATSLPDTMSSMDRRRALFESFGSSKKQRVLKSQEANVVNVDSVVGAGSVMMGAFLEGQNMSESNRQAMEQAKTGTKVDAVELAYDEARRKFLPLFDKDAKEAYLVYNARDIAGDDAWGQISRVADACLAKDNLFEALTSRGYWYDSVKTVLKAIKPDNPHVKYQTKCAILLNHMIHFHLRSRNIARGSTEEIAQSMKLPLEICNRFLEIFTTPIADDRGEDGYASSKSNRDKCLVHILLLYLMAHGRNMKAGNLKPIADDLKIELSQAANLVCAAGCTVKYGKNNVMSAALTVPFTFPPPKRGRGKG